jgi:hypothetical protein
MNISPARLRWLYLRGPLWWMGLVFAAVGVVLLSIVVTMWQDEERFAANSTRATATVTRKEQRTEMRGPKGQTPTQVFVLHFTFKDAEGHPHEGSVEAPNNDWTAATKDSLLAIEYDRTDPSNTRLPGSGETVRWGLIGAGIGAVVFLTAGLAIIVSLLVSSGRRARLVRTGTPALGVVDGVVENDSAVKLEGTFRVTYHFTDAEGTRREGRGPAQPRALASRFNAGDPILVLYDPGNPARHEPDIFTARSDEVADLQGQADEHPTTE